MRPTILLLIAASLAAPFANAAPSRSSCIQWNRGYYAAIGRKDKGWFEARLTDLYFETFHGKVITKKESVGDYHKTVEALQKLQSFHVTPISFKHSGGASVLVVRSHFKAVMRGGKGVDVNVDQSSTLRETFVYQHGGLKLKSVAFLDRSNTENGKPGNL